METRLYEHELRLILEQELNFSAPADTYEQWLSVLSIHVNELVLNNFNKLIFILYRLDINEMKLKNLLKDYTGSDAGKIIAELIIERQLQKIKSREAFRQTDAGIDDQDKW